MKWFRRLIYLGWFLWICPSIFAREIPVLFPEPLSPRIANYNIDVKLDVEHLKLHGKEVLVWHNKTYDIVTELQFHLYLNAFRNGKSTFMRESGWRYRHYLATESGVGFSDVNHIMLSFEAGADPMLLPPDQVPGEMRNPVEMTNQMEFIHPDDDNEQDRTVFRVPLPKLVFPGDSVIVYIDFTAKLPTPPYERTGAKDGYFLVAQWFPKIGVFMDDEWNCHQFHADSEFFADFGVYNVSMTVPGGNIVGATGLQVSSTNNGDRSTTHLYHAEDVHDFAWTTSPEFVEFTSRVEDVDVRLLIQPDHVDQAQRHLSAAAVAVTYFQHWYGDYPFPNLTIVDPRRGAEGSGGMEYPTLITAGTHYGLPRGVRLLESVIIHEFGHNYWYHLLASNEFEESWLDEGVDTYTGIQIMNDYYGPSGNLIDFFGIKVSETQYQRLEYIYDAHLDPVLKKAWEYYSFGSYATNSYAKPALFLITLRNYLGPEIMRDAMHTYVKRWKFKHPKTQDFIDVISDVSGQNLDWFFNQALYTTRVLDYSISSVFSQERAKPEDTGSGQALDQTDSDFSRVDALRTDAHASESGEAMQNGESQWYRSGVTVRRLGDFIFPVEIELVFEDGESIRDSWDGQALWKKFRYQTPSRLVSATVDPDGKIPLDVNFTNNSRTLEKQTLGINKVSARLQFWLQVLLEQPEFLNVFALLGDLFD